jgi:hypothetical protein
VVVHNIEREKKTGAKFFFLSVETARQYKKIPVGIHSGVCYRIKRQLKKKCAWAIYQQYFDGHAGSHDWG